MKNLPNNENSPTRLCLVFTHGVSLQTWAETGMMAREIKPYQDLARSGAAEVSFLTYGGHDDTEFQAALHPIRILPAFASKQPPKSQFALLIGGAFALFRHRASLRHCNIFKSNQMLGSHVAWLATKLFRGKFLLRTGYEFYDFARKRNSGRAKILIAWLLSHFGYKTAAHIVVATTDDAQIATEIFGAPSDRLSVQPNWIDTNHFAPTPNTSSNNRDFLTVVRLDPQKNLPALIRAASSAKASLDILGAGPLRDELVALARELRADVTFLDRVPNDRLPALIQQYKGFVLCSHFEGNPKVLLEAMSCGMPVIGTDVPGIGNLIENGANGLLCSEDATAIAAAMSRLKSNPDQAKLFGKHARETIIDHNSFAYLWCRKNSDFRL